MKNPHGVEPTRFMKKEKSGCAISCGRNHGPKFGNNDSSEIYIGNKCNKENSCFIETDSFNGSYECHPDYKSSLFVNTAGSYERNCFSVLDYEVYCKESTRSCCICH